MKNLFFTVGLSLMVLAAASAQSEFVPRVTEKGHYINQYDADGKKHGYWEAYVNEHLKLVKKKHQAAFIVMVYFHHGKNMFKGLFFDHSKKFEREHDSLNYEKGQPTLLNDTLNYVNGKFHQSLKSEFRNGYLEYDVFEYKSTMDKRENNYEEGVHSFVHVYNFKEQLKGIEGSFHEIEFKDGEINKASWIRCDNDKWIIIYNRGLCTDFTDSTITLNDQTWSSANLEVGNFKNGDLIFYAENLEDFERCEEENIPACSRFKGQMVYNWHAINDPRGLAPEGWRLASDQDFTDLRKYLGANHVDFLLSSYSEDEKAILGSNCSGFNASNMDYAGPWWSIDMENSETAHSWIIYDEALTYILEPHDTFYAVRLIKE